MPSTDLRTPRATATVNIAGAVAVESVIVSCVAGMPPTIQLNTHPRVPGDQQALSVFSSTATDFMGNVQKSMFAARSKPDVSVTMDDGSEHSVTVKGYAVSPGFGISAGSVRRPLVAVGEAALLSNLNPSVYQWSGAPSGETYNYKDTIPGCSKSSDPGERLGKVLDTLRSLWQISPPSGFGSEAAQEIAVRTDEVNQDAIQTLVEIIERSKLDIPSWKILTDQPYASISSTVNRLIANILQQSNDDFLNTIQNFCSQFQLQYVPSLENTGKFIMLEDKVTGAAEDKVAEVANIDVSAGNWSTLPVQQVLVIGGPHLGYTYDTVAQSDGDVTPTRQSILGLFAYPPVPYTGGKVHRVGLPAYIPDHVCVLSAKTVDKMTQAKPALDSAVDDGLNKKLGDLNAAIKPMIVRHARNIYADLAIGGAVVALTVPFDLSWETGKRYKVSARGGGKNLFTGWLRGVSHALSGGQKASATTSLSFTHVQCNGFELKLP